MVMAVEKFFAIYFPFQTKSICTVSAAKKILVAIAFILFIFDVHIIFIRDAKTDSKGV